MMQPESYETLNSILSQEEADISILRRILKSGDEEIDLEAIEEEILREQLRLRSLNMKSSDQYRMLDVLSYV
ncbi:hypothetical protein G6F56_013421 [Rhizopus delemar]|nr:hypothetical protein G6F56_013421 [Rhizopus delemar]